MNFAEGKGPKQVKSQKFYPLGQFVTIYGNDGTPGTVNPPATAYTPAVGTTNVSGTQWTGGMVGSVVPGLNVNINGNGITDVGFVCSPGSNESVQDLLYPAVSLSTDVNFTGSGIVSLQGTSNRYLNNTTFSASNWITISGVTVSGSNNTFTIGSINPTTIYNAYRLVISGYTGCSGIVNWSIAGMFTDFNAMGIGNNAADANGNLGQMSIQGPRYLTISGGQITSTVNGTPPYAPVKNSADFIG
jgi:hypothetical protein